MFGEYQYETTADCVNRFEEDVQSLNERLAQYTAAFEAVRDLPQIDCSQSSIYELVGALVAHQLQAEKERDALLEKMAAA